MKLELAKIRSQVAAAFSYFGPCRRSVSGSTHSGKRSGTRSWIVVARRPAPLRRIHPVREVEDVEPADEPLDRGPAAATPRRPQRVRDERGPHLDVEPGQCLLDPLPPAPSRGPEGDQLVLAAGRFREPCDHAADVVPNPGEGAGKRTDVDDDAHPRGLWLDGDDQRVRAGLREPEHAFSDEVERDCAAAARGFSRNAALDRRRVTGGERSEGA